MFVRERRVKEVGVVDNIVTVGVLFGVVDHLIRRPHNVGWRFKESDVAAFHDCSLRRVEYTIGPTVVTKCAGLSFPRLITHFGRMRLDVHKRLGSDGTKDGHVRYVVVHLEVESYSSQCGMP